MRPNAPEGIEMSGPLNFRDIYVYKRMRIETGKHNKSLTVFMHRTVHIHVSIQSL